LRTTTFEAKGKKERRELKVERLTTEGLRSERLKEEAGTNTSTSTCTNGRRRMDAISRITDGKRTGRGEKNMGI
jgi:hypothetical protein